MADIRPFAGIQFDLKSVGCDLSKLVTQPYDKISPDLQQDYYARCEHNIIRIEKNIAEVSGDPYITSKSYLDQWLADGTLKPAATPAFYYLEQTFTFGEETVTRKALIGMGRLHDYKDGVVFPHEQTLKGPKVDRLELIRATKINLGQIFMLYEDPKQLVQATIDNAIKGQKPWARFVDDEGITQTIYIITDSVSTATIHDLMKDKQLFIADGHHRYETALGYSLEEAERTGNDDPNAWSRFAMMSMVNAYDPGLLILPTHRLINKKKTFSLSALLEGLKPDFKIEKKPFPADLEKIHTEIKSLPAHSVYLFHQDDTTNLYQLTLTSSPYDKLLPQSLTTLDVYMLHEAILAKQLGVTPEDLANHTYITYKRDPAGTCKAVIEGKEQMAFLLKPTDVEDVIRVARDRQTMPQKSTDFFPKLLTGYVIADVASA